MLATSPLWLWQWQATTSLNVLIIDKTVPDQSYREHKGLVWLLNHLKLTKGNDEPYQVEEDYVGFIPSEHPPTYDVRQLPEDLSDYNYIYIADTYGVYTDEYVGTNEDGRRSELIEGGMTADEVNIIKRSLYENNQTLIAEFNTFGSPTEPDVKKQLYELLNVEWTGWIGRPFYDLSDEEVPEWVKENYEKQYDQPYTFSGYGLVFVSEEDQVLILTDEDIQEEGVRMRMTELGEEVFQMKGTFSYEYWFDIVQEKPSTNVHAQFDVSLSASGQEKLSEHGLPSEFPAVMHYEHSHYHSYYFAGDFVDQQDVPTFYQAKGIPWWKKMTKIEEKGRTDTFFWKAYVPLMTSILKGDHSIKETSKVSDKVTIKDGMQIIGQAHDDYLQVYRNGAWEDILVKGVNMGIAKPGYFPGETAITKEEYARWFDMISEMNANAVRIYTIHPPEFYEAFYEHNEGREEPLYLFHGVWVNEEAFVEKNNAYDDQVTSDFKEEIKRIVDIVHGNAELEERPGHASGQYVYNISDYVLGWILGVEWDPEVVVNTNEKNNSKQTFDGTYIHVQEASPFEVWLAKMMDYTATYEADTYNTQRLLSFTNWVTTDLLDHPSEPLEKEDMVSIDPHVIQATDKFHPGLFASYHIYPYYPDFLNLEEKYTSYIDHRGEKNNYAGYLNDVKKHHDLPIVVAEFGVPASRGMTHKNIYGKHQGFHTEQAQGTYVSEMFEDIVVENMAGGLVFTWQDEWFKRTWNTMDYDNPDERPYWDNIQTNEQHFGLLSFDPQTEETLIKLDGKVDDWEAREETPIYVSDDGMMEQVFVTSDERGIYVRVEFDDTWRVGEHQTFLLLDTIKGQGQSNVPNIKDFEAEGIDFVAHIQNKEQAYVLVDSYYDTFYYHYGDQLNMLPQVPYAHKKDNGQFHPIRLALNKEMTIEKDGETIDYPFEFYETGKLTFGNSDPHSNDFNSLADYYIDEASGVLEFRLPWLMLNFKDPSKKEIMGDMWTDEGIDASEFIDEILLALVVTDPNEHVVETVPQANDRILDEWIHYTWDNWEKPEYHERLKQSYFILQKTFGDFK